jgi:myo-inositol-1-phosphate synthase
VQPATKVGVLFVGLGGAVASTTIAGIAAAIRGLALPVGAITESVDCAGLDLAPLAALVFGGWDIDRSPLSERLRRHRVVSASLVDTLAQHLDLIRVEPGIVTNLDSTLRRLSRGPGLPELGYREAVDQLLTDITAFRARHQLERVVVVNCSSTDRLQASGPAHLDIASLERGIEQQAPEISNGMLYGYAAISAGCGVVNFTPNTVVEIPALQRLACERGVPLAGRDGKTGQTLYKTVLAPMLRARHLKLKGWYSANILGNTDGKVLDDPLHAMTKIRSKESVLEQILGYDDFTHRVRIDYYPPRGDAKEAWDCIDFEGWLQTPMSMRIDWQGSDSVLAAPLVLDLVRLMDLALQRGEGGPLAHLAMFFKDPYGTSEHDFFRQLALFQSYVERCRAEAPASPGVASP